MTTRCSGYSKKRHVGFASAGVDGQKAFEVGVGSSLGLPRGSRKYSSVIASFSDAFENSTKVDKTCHAKCMPNCVYFDSS